MVLVLSYKLSLELEDISGLHSLSLNPQSAGFLRHSKIRNHQSEIRNFSSFRNPKSAIRNQ